MRRKPVTRDEVRFGGRRILTLPADAVREDASGRLGPVPKLWAPLLRSLNRKQALAWPTHRKRLRAAGIVVPEKPPAPILCPRPYRSPLQCRRCGREFYRSGRVVVRYCSDSCAEAVTQQRKAAANAARVKAQSQARALARADRRCGHCGEPLSAQRSTQRYCSTRCRVAAHRQTGEP
jgi:hypothetical protein